MTTQRTGRDEPASADFYEEDDYRMPGLREWLRRNVWLLIRLGMVIIFSFGTSLIADQFSYGLEFNPIELTTEEINAGTLPAGAEIGDYVRITGTAAPTNSVTPENIGTEESGVGISARYSVPYFYFQLQETGDNMLIQTGNSLPDFTEIEGQEQVWEGSLSTVGTVIFFDTTQDALMFAGLPQERGIPVVEVGETPETYRTLFPTYTVVVAVWIASLVWLLWKRNTPFV